jgi:cytochrome c oxidase cbb3-type subunit 4
MDITLLRIGATLVSLIMFIAIVAWAWSRRNRAAWGEAAAIPFQQD